MQNAECSLVSFMRKLSIVVLWLVVAWSLIACSPRDLLSRRLAADLIEGSDTFKAPQAIFLRTGIVSNKDYLSPESLVLQHHGWVSATTAPCPPALVPPPCWDVVLTPSGVETIRPLLAPADAGKPLFSLPAARRELVAVTGVSKQGNVADVDFIWRWQPLFGITFLALVNSAWMLIVRAIYARIDKENLSSVATWSCAFFGFTLSLLGQFYVLPYRETAPPAALFVLATGASASPLLVYLLYRAFKPNACR